MRKNRNIMLFGVVFSLAPAFLFGLKTALDVNIAYSSVRILSLSTNYEIISDYMPAVQINQNVTVYLPFGGIWTAGVSLYGNNYFLTNQGAALTGDAFQKLFLRNSGLNFMLFISCLLFDALTLEMDYAFSSSIIMEQEPSVLMTYSAPLGLDWFEFSASLGGGYYSSQLGNGFGFSFMVIPRLVIPDSYVTLGLTLSAGYVLQGYRGSESGGFDNLGASLFLNWLVTDWFSVIGSVGYTYTILKEESYSFDPDDMFYQAGVSFALM